MTLGKIGTVGHVVNLNDLLAAARDWQAAKAMECEYCDQGHDAAPCTCDEAMAADSRAEKRLLEVLGGNR